MPDSSKAVFLSYASQDAEVVLRIAEALRASGVEVWFDRDELVGGDAWDAKIRGQIASCALFVPVISAATQARHEGYFRLEWKLAAQRTHMMSGAKAFLLPVVIDETRDAEAHVPGEFKAVQWTRLPDGETSETFCARVKKLLGGDVGPAGGRAPAHRADLHSTASSRRRGWRALPWLGAAAVAALAWWQPWQSPPTSTVDAAKSAASAGLRLDAKSIAVLPFENLSAEADAALFADGMHEEMLTALGRVSAFKVIARASVLPYRDPTQRDLRRIAADLEIGSVVEGSVRRMGSRVRIAVKLIDAQSRRQLWGDTFERDSADVFSIQAAVAQEVAGKLRATLTPGEQASLAERPSSNARAYALYVEAKALLTLGVSKREIWDQKVAKLEQATQLDPQFAGAFAQLSSTHSDMYFYTTVDGTPARMELARRALAEAQRLAPDHGETSLAAGKFAYACEADYPKALRYFELALRWNPNDDAVRGAMGTALRRLGRHVEGAAEIEKAFALNPAGNAGSYSQSLLMLRRYREYLAVKDRELRLAGSEDSRQRLRSLAMWPRFEITGDRDRFFRELAEDVTEASPSRRLGAEVRLALHRGDWAGTLALLSEERLAPLEPADATYYLVIRARMAFVLGRRDILQSAAERALALNATVPGDRFREFTLSRLEVQIAALLGRQAEFQRAADTLRRLSQEDRFVEPANLFTIATGHLILGDKATALQHLETLMTGPSPQAIGPRSIRLDPFWGKLVGDARFEEILRNAKPL